MADPKELRELQNGIKYIVDEHNKRPEFRDTPLEISDLNWLKNTSGDDTDEGTDSETNAALYIYLYDKYGLFGYTAWFVASVVFLIIVLILVTITIWTDTKILSETWITVLVSISAVNFLVSGSFAGFNLYKNLSNRKDIKRIYEENINKFDKQDPNKRDPDKIAQILTVAAIKARDKSMISAFDQMSYSKK
jgi:hypothetical protein